MANSPNDLRKIYIKAFIGHFFFYIVNSHTTHTKGDVIIILRVYVIYL